MCIYTYNTCNTDMNSLLMISLFIHVAVVFVLDILILYAVSSVIGFPELEIVGCPARYDRQSEVYTVDFQWEAPFSPAALSHIRVFAIRADVLLRLVANEFAVARVGVFFADVPVNVSS